MLFYKSDNWDKKEKGMLEFCNGLQKLKLWINRENNKVM